MNNVAIAEAYYTAMNQKNINEVANYLHADVKFTGPMGELVGKASVLKGATKFNSSNQAMLTYDLICPEPIGTLKVASLFNVFNDLITGIELLFDTKVFC